MPKILALSPKDCQGKSWRMPADLAHLQHQSLIPLHAGELAKAAASMPLALLKQGGKWQLVAVCGQQAQQNLFIKNGEWLGGYQPAFLSSYPFDIVTVGDKGIATFDEASGLLDMSGQGEAFFDDAGQFMPAVTQRIEVLKDNIGLQHATQKAVEALQQAGVIMPWPESITNSAKLTIQGLHMVDEKALSQLSDQAFLMLRAAQALPIAYALNFSIQQAHLLHRLARLRDYVPDEPKGMDHTVPSFQLLDNNGTFSFGL